MAQGSKEIHFYSLRQQAQIIIPSTYHIVSLWSFEPSRGTNKIVTHQGLNREFEPLRFKLLILLLLLVGKFERQYLQNCMVYYILQ